MGASQGAAAVGLVMNGCSWHDLRSCSGHDLRICDGRGKGAAVNTERKRSERRTDASGPGLDEL